MNDLIKSAQAALSVVQDMLLERVVDTKRLTALGRDLESALAVTQQADPSRPSDIWEMRKCAAYLKAHPQECEEFFRAAGVDGIVAAAQQAALQRLADAARESDEGLTHPAQASADQTAQQAGQASEPWRGSWLPIKKMGVE